MANKGKVELDEVVSTLKESAEEMCARSAMLSYVTQDGWNVSIKVEKGNSH